jgi:hypothetical protein
VADENLPALDMEDGVVIKREKGTVHNLVNFEIGGDMDGSLELRQRIVPFFQMFDLPVYGHGDFFMRIVGWTILMIVIRFVNRAGI